MFGDLKSEFSLWKENIIGLGESAKDIHLRYKKLG